MSDVGYKKPPKDKQFKKGQSGNPKGKPKGIPNAKTRYNRFLQLTERTRNPITGTEEEFTVAELMDLMIIAKARKGDLAAYKEILDRTEGKPQQSIDHTTDGEKLPTPILPAPQELAEKAKDAPKPGEEVYDEPLIPEDD